jgi:Fibronectin type III domain
VGVGDPPEAQGAKVKLDLKMRNDPALSQFSLDHITGMTGNANFPTPTPTAPDFLAALTAFQTAYSAAEVAKAAAKQAVSEKDEARAYLELMLTQRGNYVQIASNGNAPVILSANFPVRNAPTPVGELEVPIGLLLTLNGTPGVMHLSWSAVKAARSYVIQCSPADTMVREWSPFKMSTTTKLKIEGLTLGQVYAFRIAAIGGSTGQSDWSAEVIRMAA